MFSLKFLAGAAIGYVAGTAAGRERFEQFKDQFRKLTGTETVQQLQSDLSAAANRAGSAVSEKVEEQGAKISGRGSGESEEDRSATEPSPAGPMEGSSVYGSTPPSTGVGTPGLTSAGTVGAADMPSSTVDPAVDEPLIPDTGPTTSSVLDSEPLTSDTAAADSTVRDEDELR